MFAMSTRATSGLAPVPKEVTIISWYWLLSWRTASTVISGCSSFQSGSTTSSSCASSLSL